MAGRLPEKVCQGEERSDEMGSLIKELNRELNPLKPKEIWRLSSSLQFLESFLAERSFVRHYLVKSPSQLQDTMLPR